MIILCTSNTINLENNENIKLIRKNIECEKLYSILTENGDIKINNYIFKDYNNGIEKYID